MTAQGDRTARETAGEEQDSTRRYLWSHLWCQARRLARWDLRGPCLCAPSPRVAEVVKRLGEPAKFCGRCILFIAVAVLLQVFDPFGLSDGSNWYSADLYARIVGAARYPDSSRDKIVVIIVTEQDLAGQSERWPTSYDFHARVLSALLQHNPRAVFVDIALIDDRSTIDETIGDLQEVVEEYDKTPLFLAEPVTKAEGGPGIIEPLARAKTVAVPGAGFQRRNLHYPLWERSVAASDRTGSQSEAGQSSIPLIRVSAACALYEAGERLPQGWCRKRELAPGEEAAMMAMTWASRKFETRRNGEPTLFNGPYRCKDLPDGIWGRAWEQVKDLVEPSIRTLRQTCPPHWTFTVEQLLYGGLAERELEGIYVLYGAALIGVADRVEPPTHTPIPAVYLHAMALDNLLVYGDGYVMPERRFLGMPAKHLVAFAALLLLVPIWERLLMAIKRRHAEGRRTTDRAAAWSAYWRWLGMWATGALLTVFVIAAAIAISVGLRLSPVNYVGLTGLVFVRSLVPALLFLLPPLWRGLGGWAGGEKGSELT